MLIPRRMVQILILLCLLPVSSWSAGDPVESIDELVERFDDSACRQCHGEIYAQWQESWHSRSLVAAVGITKTFLETGLKKQWQTAFSKAHLMKCLHCHAPTVQFASEELARHIAELILAAAREPDSEAGQKARSDLSRFGVGCWSCHNLRATTYLTNTRGEPTPGTLYGAAGKTCAAHETVAAVQLKRSMFCSQCHGVWTAPDGELMTCATIPSSYYHNYKASGGAQSCQDCHMGEGKGHRMPGGHFIEMVREGLNLRLEIDSYLHLPEALEGKGAGDAPIPSAVVTAYVENRAGHRVPDG